MNTLDWIRSGDPSLDYLVDRDLFDHKDEQKHHKIGKIGWCFEYIKNRKSDGSWGNRFYQPKWICSHYTILELRNLEYPPTDKLLQKEINKIGLEELASDGGINPSVTMDVSDTCVTAMYLNYAIYYQAEVKIIERIIDYLLNQRMNDGGYNCNFNQKGAVHSSFHTSICVLEAYQTYISAHHSYRIKEVIQSKENIIEFLLVHKFYRSSSNNDVIDKKMLMMTYPFRWKYTTLRALNVFVDCDVKYDKRMNEILDIIESKCSKDCKWKIQTGYAGNEYFKMEEAGKPSKIITYMAIKILRKYRKFDLTIAST
jgi:hypothetical protein